MVLDTETTGLYNKTNALEKQPYIIQFAGIVGTITENGEWVEEQVIDEYIKPPISIPYELSQNVHHIYDVDVKNKENSFFILPNIIKQINEVDVIIGHNIEFDLNCLKIEVERIKQEGMLIDLIPKKVFCTMNESVQFCRLKKKEGKGFKRPKLQELCKCALGEYFSGAHNALQDIAYTLKCFLSLYGKGIFKLEEREQQGLF